MTEDKGCMFKNAASAYVLVFSLLHLIAPFMGLWIKELGQTLSALVLVLGGGILSMGAVFLEYRLLRAALCVGYAFAWMAEWTRLMTWVPAWSGLQYVVAASMNFVNAACLALLGELWKIG